MGNTANIPELSAKPEIYYSHIPTQGVSVGAMKVGGEILFSACFTNTGISMLGKFHRHKRDHFSRKRSREILKGRLLKETKDLSTIGRLPRLVYHLQTTATLKDFMWVLREHFKPKDQPGFYRSGTVDADWQSLIALAQSVLGEAERLPARLAAEGK